MNQYLVILTTLKFIPSNQVYCVQLWVEVELNWKKAHNALQLRAKVSLVSLICRILKLNKTYNWLIVHLIWYIFCLFKLVYGHTNTTTLGKISVGFLVAQLVTYREHTNSPDFYFSPQFCNPVVSRPTIATLLANQNIIYTF